jgi:steroid delta-isomerase-like uncharacterized protein
MGTRINLTKCLVISTLFFGFSGNALAKDSKMMAAKTQSVQEKNKALTKSFYDNVFNKHNINAMDPLIDVNLVDHDPSSMGGGGLAGLKKDFTAFFKAFPDLHVTPKFMVAEGDKVVIYYNMTGTNKGAFMGQPASGKKINIDGIDIVRIANGKAVEHWAFGDSMAMMQQMSPAKAKK